MARHRSLPVATAIVVAMTLGPCADTIFASDHSAAVSGATGPAVTVDRPALVTENARFAGSPPFAVREMSTWAEPEDAARADVGNSGERIPSLAETYQTSSPALAAQRGRYGRGRRGGGWNRTAGTEILLGAAAAITGGALLVYANRPECSADSTAGGCGYGTKVVGGAVLTGGLVGLVVGAATWR